MSMIDDGWQGILDRGEKLVWQGRPSAALRLAWRTPFEGLMAAFFVGFSLFWMHGASQAGGDFWMFGLIFFAVGVYQLIGVHFWTAYVRAGTTYTLTDRRALVATARLGRRDLKSYPITATTELVLKDGMPGSVFFATTTRFYGRGGSTSYPVGFDFIEDARAVYQRMLSVQQGKA